MSNQAEVGRDHENRGAGQKHGNKNAGDVAQIPFFNSISFSSFFALIWTKTLCTIFVVSE